MKENRTEFNLWQPVFLHNHIQHYAWGERGPEAFIPRLLKIEADPDTPYAELWIGSHPIAPSSVVLGEKKIPLNRWILENPEPILGKRVVEKFGPHLPFLLKVLSAAEALSIQVHPNKEQAERLHARDPEHYPDANHKPEIAIALDGLKALAGFKSFEETVAVLRELPEIAEFVADEAGEPPRETEAGKKWVRRVYLAALRKSEENPQGLRELLQKLDNRFNRGSSGQYFLQNLYAELRKKYKDDVGLLSLFLLQLVELNPGEAIFIDAGVPHAYLRGNIIECMANSDNVVRAGLTPKYKDVAAMEEIIQPEPRPVPVQRPNPEAQKIVFETPVEEFRVTRFKLIRGQIQKIQTADAVQIILVIEGSLRLFWKRNGKENSLTLHKGNSVLIPAVFGEGTLISLSEALIFTVDLPE